MSSTNPMEILKTFPLLFNDASMSSLGMIMRRAGIVACVIAIAVSLVGIIFSGNPQNVAEGKKDIINKLFVIFVLTSLAVIFSIVKNIFDNALMHM